VRGWAVVAIPLEETRASLPAEGCPKDVGRPGPAKRILTGRHHSQCERQAGKEAILSALPFLGSAQSRLARSPSRGHLAGERKRVLREMAA
jgi:hypothetical protein